MRSPGSTRPVLRDIGVLCAWALRESVRRRVFVVVAVLTAGFLLLFGFGVRVAYRNVTPSGPGLPVSLDDLAGATLLGLAMFADLFLGTVLAVFLTLGAVRGEAEAGMLQQVVVRPVGRWPLLAARWLAASTVCAVYSVVVFLVSVLLVRVIGGWSPGSVVTPALGLVAALSVLAAVSLLASVLLGSVANGITVFMLFGAGLFAGLLGQVADAVHSSTLQTVSTWASWALPFEALYQNGLAALTSGVGGITGVIVRLGPFGGARDASVWLFAYAAAYIAAVGALAAGLFARRDL